MGERGGPPLHAIYSALQDALRASGAVITDTHNPMERVWHMLHDPSPIRGIEVRSRSARP